MANPPETVLPAAPPPTGTRWLWVVRIAAVVSASLIALVFIRVGLALVHWKDGRRAPPVLLCGALLVPYILILAWLQGTRQKKALALAAATGWGGILGPLLGSLTISGDPATGSVLALPNALLALSAKRAHAALRRETRDPRPLRGESKGWAVAGGLVGAGFFALAVLPAEPTRSQVALRQASTVGSLRTINTAEMTYAETYKTGYSPTLAALGPSTGNAQPSASAADLIGEVLASGTKSGYIFAYSAAVLVSGKINAYTVLACPTQGCPSPTSNNGNSYFTDESGVIRQNMTGPATAKDPPLGG